MTTNTITFAGNLTADPELRYTTGGRPVTEFRVMVNRRTKNPAGEWVDAPATGHTCKAWGQLAENIAESFRKGQRVLITGHIETESWKDRETGDDRFKDVVLVADAGPSMTRATAQVTKNTRQADSDGS